MMWLIMRMVILCFVWTGISVNLGLPNVYNFLAGGIIGILMAPDLIKLLEKNMKE